MTDKRERRNGGQERRGARLEFPGTGVSVPYPGEDDPEAEARAIEEAYAKDPAFRAMADETARNKAEGKGIPADDVYRELGYTPPARRAGNGAPANGRGAARHGRAKTHPK
jgi:hypothetical protein